MPSTNIIRRTWTQGAPLRVEALSGVAFTGESGAHQFIIDAVNAAGAAVALSGTVTAKFLRADDTTIQITGAIANGAALVTLVEDCYHVAGRFNLAVYVTVGTTVTCVYDCVGNVYRTTSETVTDGSDAVPNLEELQAAYEATQQATADAEEKIEELDGYADELAALENYVRGMSPAATAQGAAAVATDAAPLTPDALEIAVTATQSGSGDPSPENIRPFTGHTGANIQHAGKNLLPGGFASASNTSNGLTFTFSGGNHVEISGTTTDQNATSNYYFLATADHSKHIHMEPGQTLTMSIKNTGLTTTPTIRIFLRPAEGTTNIATPDSTTLAWSFTATEAVDIYKIGLRVPNSGVSVNLSGDLQFEFADAPTDYEAPRGLDTDAVAFPAAAGTVYGGVVDVAEGALRVTHGHIASYAGEALPGVWASDRDVYAPGTTPTLGAEVVYALAEPTLYDLDVTLFALYRGGNTVWADTGDTYMTYRKDVAALLARLIDAQGGD